MDGKDLEQLREEYKQLLQEERECQKKLNEIMTKRVEVQREIAKSQTTAVQGQMLTSLYEQRNSLRSAKKR